MATLKQLLSSSLDLLYNSKPVVSFDEDAVYIRSSLYTCTKRGVTMPAGLKVAIGGTIYTTTSAVSLALSSPLAGADYYIYACAPTSGSEPVFVISSNSTVPDGYTSDNSRKIGGFHTLCADVGTPTYADSVTGETKVHWLSGYVAGDILPASCWDLYHRPACGSPEGMVYGGSVGVDVWMDIYLDSWDGTKLVSKYGQATADGASTKPFHGELFSEALATIGKRLPYRNEFVLMARGSNEQTNIYGSADATTTGGHVDTASARMISNVGLEDACGFLWQWTSDLGFAGGSSWAESVYNSGVDGRSYGQSWGTLYRLRVGGSWAASSNCGSRSCKCDYAPASVGEYTGGRGVSEPLYPDALSAVQFTNFK